MHLWKLYNPVSMQATETAPAAPRVGVAMATALRQLRHMIVTGELAPGEQIRQQETADLLGVSRVPLREAMNVLANQGLLLHRPNQGYFVVKRAPGELAQIRRMMHALENELVKTMTWPDKKGLAQLRALNARMRETVRKTEWAQLATLNRDFHFAIYTLSPDHLILAEVQRLWSLADPFVLVKFESIEARARTVDEHEEVVDALQAQNRPAFRRAMEHHRTSSMQGVASALGSGPDPHGLRRLQER
jgi:DNA-binding GntR family transcriptional regulator